MAKVYGNRWELIESIARGGQGEVFRVKDLDNKNAGNLALKRVLNPKRFARFRNEVDAVKRLDHPHIIKLIDHSALDVEDSASEKQFIVMPLAKETLSDRVSLYKGSIDTTIKVAKQLSSALSYAHTMGVIHRDVKPQNILFRESSHEAWLADFGICLIRESERLTDTPEVVGPVQFMAPELDSGGHLEVSPSADVYSLGKVIYYMLSGGIVIPRERMSEASYAGLFDHENERFRLMKILLQRMICPIDRRIDSMGRVTAELDLIEEWERSVSRSIISPNALSAIEAMKVKAFENQAISDRNKLAREIKKETLQVTKDSIIAWLEAELRKMVSVFEQGDAFQAGVRKSGGGVQPVGDFQPNEAVEFFVRNKLQVSDREQILRLSFCTKFSVTVRTHLGSGPFPPEPPVPEHSDVAILPTCGQAGGNIPNRQVKWSLFTKSGELYSQDNDKQSSSRPFGASPFTQQPKKAAVQVHLCQFSTSQWPEIADTLRPFLTSCFDAFAKACARHA